MTWSYDPSTLATNTTNQVRFLVGDTEETDPLVQNEEIVFALSQRSSIYGAASIVCRTIAAKFSRLADTVDRDLRDALSSKAKAYAMRAQEYDTQAKGRSGVMPYAGGISIADKVAQELNLDRVPPSFNREMDTNYLPVAPVGNEGTPLPSIDSDTDDNV